jgi:ribonuclease HI
MIEIYTDGSAKNNGSENSFGGVGICVISQGKVLLAASYQEQGATNNQMELKGLIYALHLAQTTYAFDICRIKSDSAYCVNMFNDWIEKWCANGWTRAGNKSIENLDLVKKLYEYKKINYPNFKVERIPGHAGELGNEIADALATNDRTKLEKLFLLNDINPVEIKNIDLH